jgi:hypothetical protein
LLLGLLSALELPVKFFFRALLAAGVTPAQSVFAIH